MAVLAVCITAGNQARLLMVVSATSLLATTISALYLVAVIYSLVRHSFLLRDLLISLLDLLYLILILRGVLLLTLSLACWKIIRNIAFEPLNPSLSRTVLVWSTLTLLCCVSAIVWGVTEPGVRSRLEEAVSQRYKLAVKRYSDSDVWLHTLDRVHDYMGCCGVDNYSDWYSTTWLSLNRLPGDPVLYTKEVQPNGQVLVPLVPSSCCRVTSPDCGHLAWLQSNRSWTGLRPVDPSLLYTAGCAPAIARIFAIDLMLCRLLVLAVAALQVIMLVGTRYVWSASYNSILLGRPQGAAPGWLVSGCGVGELHEHNKRCGDWKDQNVENNVDKKRRWRCIDKFRGKWGKEADYDGLTKSKSGRSISPCLDKLKQKLKGTNKSKQNGESKINLDVETEFDSMDDEDTNNVSPTKYAQAKSNNITSNFTYEETEALPLLPKHQNVRVFEMTARQKSPFIEAQSTANNTNSLQNHDNSRFLKKAEIVNPKTGLINRSSFDSDSGKDFQKTRSLFEKVARRVSPRTFYAKKQTQQNPVNEIEFEDSPRSKKLEQTTRIQLDDRYSPRSEPDSIPVVLRNYRIPPNV